MNVTLKCFSTLVNPDTCDFKNSTTYELDDGQTLQDLAGRAGIDGNNVKIAFVNSRNVEMNTVLADRDQVGLAPAVGGM
jgi:molybdopterin converting factor small subunit